MYIFVKAFLRGKTGFVSFCHFSYSRLQSLKSDHIAHVRNKGLVEYVSLEVMVSTDQRGATFCQHARIMVWT